MSTLIMGIVNATPDSFSDGGAFADHAEAVAHGRRLRAEGAAILDVGGESTRPGAERVPAAIERERVLPVIAALAADGATVSVDTMNAATAIAAVDAGATIVNDVSGGLADPGMLAAVAGTSAELIVGHWRGPSADMYARAEYVQIGREVAGELLDRVEAAQAAGIPPSRIIVDPGIGFAKTAEQNWRLLESLGDIVSLGHRVLLGTSRKRFLADALGAEASLERRDLATAVTSVLAEAAGAWAVRVHDVASTRDALRVAGAWKSGGRGLS
ncbi:MAG TPA: dihydropteroate synthase [Microbacterium sp.]|uniref:dihydropteroate synthase n=1 Tax=Microbacterium sp. TaxID=51671 RepID=UPI002CFCE42D|nr:dihydropteroate synthase [Microbacterium sp.]HWI31101.1 dihydropteroate synthase [Microbacterium sp.]